MNLLLSAIQLTHSVSSDGQAEDRHKEQTILLEDVRATLSANDVEQVQMLRHIENLLRNPPTQPLIPQRVAQAFFVQPFMLSGAPLAPAFVQRPDLLHALETGLLPISEDHQTVLVLQGMGGIGKSQMAREYASRHQNDYTAIFWVNAKSEASLRISIARIAERLSLVKVLDETRKVRKDEGGIAAAIEAVHAWLDEDANTRWLLILDNVDSQPPPNSEGRERQMLRSDPWFDVAQYLPSSTHGTVLVTSRLSYLGRQLGGLTHTMSQMTTQESLEVMFKLSGRKHNESVRYYLVFIFVISPSTLEKTQCNVTSAPPLFRPQRLNSSNL